MQVKKLAGSVFTALPDGTGVLLNLATLIYFGLNSTGASVWQEIDQVEAADLDQLVQCVCARFEVDRAFARKEIAIFIERLASLGLIQII
ncbi:MAG TPA: PqqD family protein [Blastocatellia bacterium]|nr:PqqD family protein [Blastocatellia bacterium]